jgi:tryptophan synthase alpha chain
MTKFIGYLPAGFPSQQGSIDALKTLVDAGTDILEVGVPYSDPVMDGVAIQEATSTALKGGFRFEFVFDIVSQVYHYAKSRFLNEQAVQMTEIYIMSYFNPIFKYGLSKFAMSAAKAGVTGVIIPDLIPDEAVKWQKIAAAHDLKTVFLTAPNSSNQRLEIVAQAATGFVYASSLLGVTGERSGMDQFKDAKATISRVRSACEREDVQTPIYMGLGVSTAEQAHEVAKFADGVIVGSKLVTTLANGGKTALYDTARDFKTAIGLADSSTDSSSGPTFATSVSAPNWG